MHCVSLFGVLRKLARELDWPIGYKVFLAARPHSVFNRSLHRLVGSISSMNSSIRHIPAIFTIPRLGSGFIASSRRQRRTRSLCEPRTRFTEGNAQLPRPVAFTMLPLASIVQILRNLKFTACPRNYTSSVDFGVAFRTSLFRRMCVFHIPVLLQPSSSAGSGLA